jgi:hypothetical protein
MKKSAKRGLLTVALTVVSLGQAGADWSIYDMRQPDAVVVVQGWMKGQGDEVTSSPSRTTVWKRQGTHYESAGRSISLARTNCHLRKKRFAERAFDLLHPYRS